MNRQLIFENYISTQLEQTGKRRDVRQLLEENAYDYNIGPYLPNSKNARILDVGFGRGEFLQYLKNRGYTNVYGVEASKEAVEYVKARGICDNVYLNYDIEIFLASQKPYDLITMIDVLEHIEKSKTLKFLESIKKGLNAKGKLVIRVPNGSNPLNSNIWWCDFTHEFIYTAHSLRQVMSMVGFQNISIFPYREENVTLHGKITNLTQKIVVPAIKLVTGLCRADLQEDALYSKTIICVVEMD